MKLIILLIVIVVLITMGCNQNTEKTSDANNVSELIISGNLNITGNLIFMVQRNCTNRTGNFSIKSLTTGTEKERGIIEKAVKMISYDDDFKKINSTYFETRVTYAKFIASEHFKNESKCTKIIVGTSAEINEESKWYNSKKPLLFYNFVSYYCIDRFTQITYCD